MFDIVKGIFVVGTVAWAAGTGTWIPLLLAGGFSYGVYYYTKRGADHRMSKTVQNQANSLDEFTTFLDRFLAKKDDGKKASAWDDSHPDMVRLRSLCCRKDKTKKRVLIEPTPTIVYSLQQRATARRDAFDGFTRKRKAQNHVAAVGTGVATFIWPLVGVAAIGYTVYRDRRMERARSKELQQVTQGHIQENAEYVKHKIAELIKQQRIRRTKDERHVSTEVTLLWFKQHYSQLYAEALEEVAAFDKTFQQLMEEMQQVLGISPPHSAVSGPRPPGVSETVSESMGTIVPESDGDGSRPIGSPDSDPRV